MGIQPQAESICLNSKRPFEIRETERNLSNEYVMNMKSPPCNFANAIVYRILECKCKKYA